MKKTLFALEVLLMLSALPLFCGMAMGRKHHLNTEAGKFTSHHSVEANSDAYTVYRVALKNS